MPGYGDPPANRKKFSSEYQPKNRGRKPSVLKKYVKENGLGIDDIRNSFAYVLSCSRDELMALVADKGTPAIIAIAASALLGDIKKNNLSNISIVLDKANLAPKKSQDDTPEPETPEGQGQFTTYSFPEADPL